MKKEMELVRQDMLNVLARIEGAAEALGYEDVLIEYIKEQREIVEKRFKELEKCR